MFSHTSANRDESRYMVGGEGTFVGLGGVMGWMAKFEGEGWLFVLLGMVGVLVSERSLRTEVKEELDISTSMSVTSVSLTCSVHERDSMWSGIIWEMVEAVCRLVVCCWGLSEATSSEATSKAFCSSVSTSGNSPE